MKRCVVDIYTQLFTVKLVPKLYKNPVKFDVRLCKAAIQMVGNLRNIVIPEIRNLSLVLGFSISEAHYLGLLCIVKNTEDSFSWFTILKIVRDKMEF